MISKFNLF